MSIDNLFKGLLVPFETYRQLGGQLSKSQYERVIEQKGMEFSDDSGTTAIRNFVDSISFSTSFERQHGYPFELDLGDNIVLDRIITVVPDNIPKDANNNLNGEWLLTEVFASQGKNTVYIRRAKVQYALNDPELPIDERARLALELLRVSSIIYVHGVDEDALLQGLEHGVYSKGKLKKAIRDGQTVSLPLKIEERGLKGLFDDERRQLNYLIKTGRLEKDVVKMADGLHYKGKAAWILHTTLSHGLDGLRKHYPYI